MRKSGESEPKPRSAYARQPKPKPVAGRRAATPKEAAARVRDRGLPMSPSKLKRLRTEGGGPSYVRPRGRIHYPIDLLDAWVDRQLATTFTSTAQEPELRRSGFAS